MEQDNLVELGAKIELARRYFWYYCKLKAKDFYKDDRIYLKQFCETLQAFAHSKKKVLLVDMPPRHGKSRTLQLFVEWSFGHNKNLKVMTASYNSVISSDFAKGVRNSIQEEHLDDERPVYNDVFPDIRIKKGDGAMEKWALEGGYNNYLATSPDGTATGFGADYIIIDDLIKNEKEARNTNIKAQHWKWFTDTMLSRTEANYKIMVVMTRWATDDFAGKILKHYGDDVEHINVKAIQDDGTMLCEEILPRAEAEDKRRAMGRDIFSANYQQEPIDLQGRLYSGFKTYDGKLPKFKAIRSYTDTADTGTDRHCSFVYGVTFQNEAYILDLLYTAEPMEVTEPATADLLYRNKTNVARIESNNGGRGFARNVRRILEEDYNSNYTVIQWFTQHENKNSRILSNATWCMEHIYFPEGWQNSWPDLYDDLMSYQRAGKNAHDDAEDALTGICEDINDIIAIDHDADEYFTDFKV